MQPKVFKPGFRLSLTDVLILCVGLIGVIILASQIWSMSLIIAVVVLHFFLFCNVFRISRPPELIWASVFIVLAGSTIITETPSWIVTYSISIFLSVFLIWREVKKPSYHGVCWKKWNPNLQEWWESQQT